MKVLFLTLNFPPEPSPAVRIFQLGKYLINQGHKVTVVTGFPNVPQGVIYEGYRRKLYSKETIKGMKVIRVFIYITTRRKQFLPRLLNYLSFTFTSILGAMVAGRHQIIWARTPPVFTGISAYIISLLKRKPYIVEIQDLWPKGPIALGYLKNRYLISLAKAIERFMYKKACRVYVISHTMRKEVINTGVEPGKVEIHFNWVDTNIYRPVREVTGLRKEYNLNGKFVILFAGNIGLAQGLEYVLEAAKLLQEKKDIVFVFVGGGIEKKKLLQIKELYQLQNALFIPRQPELVIPKFLSMADVLLIHLNKAEHRRAAIPSKTQAYMSCERPLLVAAECDAAEIVIQNRCGITVAPQDPEAIAEAVLYLDSTRHLLEEMGKNARDYALKSFDQQKLVQEIERSLQDILTS